MAYPRSVLLLQFAASYRHGRQRYDKAVTQGFHSDVHNWFCDAVSDTTLRPIGRADDGSHRLVVGKLNTPCPNPQYSTMAVAITGASPGDQIDICPYPKQLISTRPLKLVGVTENRVDRILCTLR